jgi:hypothetical protein
MDLQGLVDAARQILDDEKGDDTIKSWKNSELVRYSNKAEREIARQLELLRDSDTIGYVNLSGTAGQISSMSVSSVTITSAAVSFATSAAVTATNLAANINAYTSDPDYRAVARGTLVIIKANPQSGDFPTSGYTISATASGGMAATVTNLPGLCRHVVAIGQRYLSHNEKIVRIVRFKPSTQSRPVRGYERDDLDDLFPGWETYANDTILRFSPDYDQNETVVIPPPSAIELIEQEVIRLPLIDLTVANMSASPEIGVRHHETIVEGMCREAYRKNDVETLDLSRSNMHESEFNRLIEEWKREHNKRGNGFRANRMPGGVM